MTGIYFRRGLRRTANHFSRGSSSGEASKTILLTLFLNLKRKFWSTGSPGCQLCLNSYICPTCHFSITLSFSMLLTFLRCDHFIPLCHITSCLVLSHPQAYQNSSVCLDTVYQNGKVNCVQTHYKKVTVCLVTLYQNGTVCLDTCYQKGTSVSRYSVSKRNS